MKPVCPDCGSARVSFQSDAMWNEEKDDWEILNVLEEFAFCHDCEAEFQQQLERVAQHLQSLARKGLH